MLRDGKLSVVDRKSAMFKLSNGLFIAPAPLELLFEQSMLIKQALVCSGAGSGGSLPHANARGVSVVVVLTDAGVEACSRPHSGSGSTPSSAAQSASPLQFDPSPILQECAKLAFNAGKKSHEIPGSAVLTTEEWSTENGYLTSSLKICRSA